LKLDLVDTTIQTFFVEDDAKKTSSLDEKTQTYFFVVYGFRKSKDKLQNGEYGQGNLCLYIFEVDRKTKKPDFENPVFKDDEINNEPYDHCLYKNYQPILKFKNAIYYMKVVNIFSDGHNVGE
tara:strand:+ start:229 stop:597 length:369 start_codon:yes stop_codon:yes gene_type:complete